MNQQQFEKWVELLGSRIGWRASAIRKTFLQNALNMRLAATGVADYKDYYAYLHNGLQGEMEWQEFIELLAIKETRFFRHTSSLELVRQHAGQKQQRCNANNEAYSYQIWSLGCSTGEEAYTLAIVLDQLVKGDANDNNIISIVASDISRNAIDFARKGIYPAKQLSEASDEVLQNYFTRQAGMQYQIKQKIRDMVVFTNTNIVDIEDNGIGLVDTIFCQNLLIYFEHEARLNILNNLARFLLPDGLIVLGAGEIYHWNNPDMALVSGEDILAYRKTGPTQPGTH